MTDHPVDTHHEETDASVRAITWSVIGLVALLVIIFVGVWWIYSFVRGQDQARDVRRSLIPPASPIPPEPRLQVDPAEEFQSYKREQDRILSSYEWVSREQGRVRIPIQRAMDLIAQRGLPTRTSKPEGKQ
jgi:hypothetical protein